MQPQILKEFALHAETGQPMPDELIEKILAAQTFNQGFTTVEYVSCALVDLALHENTDLDKLDFQKFEAQTLQALQMLQSLRRLDKKTAGVCGLRPRRFWFRGLQPRRCSFRGPRFRYLGR